MVTGLKVSSRMSNDSAKLWNQALLMLPQHHPQHFWNRYKIAVVVLLMLVARISQYTAALSRSIETML